MDKTQLISVKNRSAGHVVYKIPETGARRMFAPGEEKKISLQELEQLTWQAGGRELIANYLQLSTSEATDELNIKTEPEYWMDEAQVKKLLETGSLDEFLDALDFAPEGVIDLIKDIAVKVRLNDYDKRTALKNKTGFDVTKALAHIDEERAEEEAPVQEVHRRVQPQTEEPGRRSTPKYNVVSKK